MWFWLKIMRAYSKMKRAEKISTLKLIVVSGVEGNSAYLDNYRIAGPKPWGGGKVIHEFTANVEDIKKALRGGK